MFKKHDVRKRRVSRRKTSTNGKTYMSKQSADKWYEWCRYVKKFYKVKSNSQNMLFVDNKNDERPFIKVSILNKELTVLLDSGASHSVLGCKGLYMIEMFELNIFECGDLNISTADGKKQDIRGYVVLPIQVENVLRLLKVLVVPSVCHSLILGIDFCNMFKLQVDFGNKTYFTGHKEYDVDVINVIRDRNTLNNEQNCRLENTIDLFKNLSWHNGSKLGRTNRIIHKIDTGDAEPVKQRQHPMSPYMLQYLHKELDQMLELGVVRPSSSPWSSPVLLVKKSNGEMRLCFDGRRLNSLTKRDAYPLPQVESILAKLSGACFLSSIDMKSAFWQIPLDESSCEKCAFSIPQRGLFEFTVMAFGLCNAAQTQQRLMDSVLGHELEDYVFVYLDDIIIATPTFEKHIEILMKVYRRLEEANLTINFEKCKFCLSSLKYLGFIVDQNGLRTDPDKVTAMLNFPRPETVTQLKRFIGMCGYYRRFLKDFSTLTAPITALMKGKRKTQKLVWNNEAEQCFLKIKEVLVTAPILANPDYAKTFSIHCDASTIGLGCMLTQQDDEGKEVVIAYASRTLNVHERNYTVTELELAAVIFGIEKFRPYVEGVKFRVITDHYSLLWLYNLKSPSPRLGRWAVRLSQFNFEVIHKKGILNVVPDGLSRAPIEVNILNVSVEDLQEDQWYKKMSDHINKEPARYPDWMIKDGYIYKHIGSGNSIDTNLPEWKMVVPKHQRKHILKKCHDESVSAHLGFFKTLNRIKELYYWPKMRYTVKKYVNNCNVCSAQKHSQKARPGYMGKAKEISFPWEVISVDIMGPMPRSKRGNTYLLVVSDYFSKYVLLHPMRNATANVVCKFIEEETILVYGAPRIITVDNATIFTSKLFTELADRYGSRIWYNARYHAQINQVERVNRVIGTAIRSYIKSNQQKDWDIEIPKISYALRTAIHESTGYSPTYINFGRMVPLDGKFYNSKEQNLTDMQIFSRNKYIQELEKLPEIYKDVQSKLKEAYSRNEYHYNLRKRPADIYQVGQRVWKKNYTLSDSAAGYSAKLAPKYVLCKIAEVLSPLVYRLRNEQNEDIGKWHVKDLKPYQNNEEEV